LVFQQNLQIQNKRQRKLVFANETCRVAQEFWGLATANSADENSGLARTVATKHQFFPGHLCFV
jgi:hypothetical protein